jgi:hypothetical protein
MRFDDNRCNEYIHQKKLRGGSPSNPQQSRQCPKLSPSQMAQEFTVGILHGFIETCQQFESVWRNPGHYHSSILSFPAARNQGALLQAVEKAGNVGIVGNHTTGNLSTRQAIRRPP